MLCQFKRIGTTELLWLEIQNRQIHLEYSEYRWVVSCFLLPFTEVNEKFEE